MRGVPRLEVSMSSSSVLFPAALLPPLLRSLALAWVVAAFAFSPAVARALEGEPAESAPSGALIERPSDLQQAALSNYLFLCSEDPSERDRPQAAAQWRYLIVQGKDPEWIYRVSARFDVACRGQSFRKAIAATALAIPDLPALRPVASSVPGASSGVPDTPVTQLADTAVADHVPVIGETVAPGQVSIRDLDSSPPDRAVGAIALGWNAAIGGLMTADKRYGKVQGEIGALEVRIYAARTAALSFQWNWLLMALEAGMGTPSFRMHTYIGWYPPLKGKRSFVFAPGFSTRIGPGVKAIGVLLRLGAEFHKNDVLSFGVYFRAKAVKSDPDYISKSGGGLSALAAGSAVEGLIEFTWMLHPRN